MRSSLAHREVETIATLESATFTIKQNYKAFKVLIDGLYSDKIRAVIRELWTNAYDSHAEAGCSDKSFECHLPTLFAPHFAVRDFGVSLTHHGVMRLYTTVFESTKEDTNQQVGKLGLGSKSPFAYTDTFTVTAWLDGEKRTYSAYIGADHVPRIDFMGAEPSDDPQGLEVSFPVKNTDINAFQAAAQRVIRGFDVEPTLLGNVFHVSPMITVMEGAGWRLVKDDAWLGSGAHARQGCVIYAHARQGCVIYPLDPKAIADLTDEQRAVLEAPVLIDFPIGDLEIAANRESLGYDEPTCRNIRLQAERIASEIAAVYTLELAAQPTYWEACKRYAAQLDDYSVSRLIKHLTGAYGSWRGRPLKKQIRLHDFLDRFSYSNLTANGIAAMRLGNGDMLKRRSPKWDPSRNVETYPKTDVVVLENVHDNLHAPGVRLQYAAERRVLTGGVLWVKCDPASTTWKRLYALLGRPPVIEMNTLEKRPVDPAKSRRRAVKMRVLNASRGRFDETDIDPEDEQVYVQMERGEVIGPKGYKCNIAIVIETARLLEKFGAITTTVIGVPATHRKVPEQHPDTMTCLWDVAREYLAKHFDADACAQAEGARQFVKNPGDVFGLLASMHKAGAAFEYTERPGYEALVWYEEAATSAAQLDRFADIRDLALSAQGVDARVDAVDPEGREDHERAFEAAYPLAADMARYSHINDARRALLIDYVNLVDRSAERVDNPVTDTAVPSGA